MIPNDLIYKLTINIYSDGDFAYSCSSPYFNEREHGIEVFSKDREKIGKIVEDVYMELSDTIETDIDHAKDAVDCIKTFKDKMLLINKKRLCYYVNLVFGNQNIYISIRPYRYKEVDGIVQYEFDYDLAPRNEFNIYNIESIDEYDWNRLKTNNDVTNEWIATLWE